MASLWDNGSDPIGELRHAMSVRQIGLASFGLENIPVGTPLSQLEATLVPLYLHHRYQLAAAAKSIGGVTYTYAVRAPQGTSPAAVQEIVAPARQRDALAAVLETLRPAVLALPPQVLALLPPRAYGFGGPNTELFPGRTEPIFDQLGVAALAAEMAVSALLQPQRAARLIDFNARDATFPDFAEVIDALLRQTWTTPVPADRVKAALHRTVAHVVITGLMQVASAPDASPLVRADAEQALRRLRAAVQNGTAGGGTGRAFTQHALDEIARFLGRADQNFERTKPLPAPPGDPIGVRP